MAVRQDTEWHFKQVPGCCSGRSSSKGRSKNTAKWLVEIASEPLNWTACPYNGLL